MRWSWFALPMMDLMCSSQCHLPSCGVVLFGVIPSHSLVQISRWCASAGGVHEALAGCSRVKSAISNKAKLFTSTNPDPRNSLPSGRQSDTDQLTKILGGNQAVIIWECSKHMAEPAMSVMPIRICNSAYHRLQNIFCHQYCGQNQTEPAPSFTAGVWFE